MNKTKTEKNEDVISWEAYEFAYHKKPAIWHMLYLAVAVILIIFAAFTGSMITIIAFVIMTSIAYYFATKSPRLIKHKLTTTGIWAGKTFYPYKNLRAFWIIYFPPEVKTLNFETTGYINNEASLQLGEQDPVKVKMFLQNFLVEDLNKEESLTDVLARKAKF